ncbi:MULTISPECIES: HlyD family efflux transporter periplasmic adaptor subunit [Pasteurellaceae]|uniref:HlyD family efflux transporter periplasmic adaptor subunit n=1 Tax=Pasteurella atlantica TaxID=2827233 RepID=A0AAW8CEE5_9PAST|nr:HlyD family efflux transporter periplasmic adaptor subunit [Pasteurella atlantica]MBR0572599.1 HlyD family efflux transporter periplasmic adaptor subunit [Pasteurella atlantica]MDP8038545.1 HlyD family efflux transporter periplasmic adaptor subunit [Pasteurella atlantica]MDP8040637.1 HlyD family efflux transporter periplasmic adaptor subunit [Pasteurella atlantica]MDP8042772.1 HlyD family efflux transporter periplasmic adaptor subunit [Pasteurella atlantica]MDP8044859.1 HlyD family efflux t
MRDLSKEIHQPKKSKIFLLLISLFLIALLMWSYETQFARVVRASGKVVSAARTQIVQNLEGGILTALYVKEGDNIKKGQIFAQFDPTRFQILVEESEKKIATYTLRKLRLEHEINGTEKLTVPALYLKQYPDLVNSEQALLSSRLKELQSRQRNLKHLIALKKQEYNKLKKFNRGGAVSSVELLNTQQSLAKLQADLDNFLSTRYKEQAETMSKAVSEISLLKERIKTAKDQLKRTIVRAPSSGTVNQIFFSTVGAVVRPGQTILEIVPNDGTILVETRVAPKDIGYVVLNMKTSLKLTAYDYSIYGTLLGKVTKIGADTVPDQNRRDRQLSYVVTIAINPDSLAKWRARKLDIRTGMVVEAELEAGSMRIIDYILRPLLKTRDALATI